MNEQASHIFEQRVHVEPDDLDERRHVNNVVYLRWIQDVAIAHWKALASPEDQEAIAWVALRHEIEYLAAALLGDEIIVRTWVGVAERLSFERLTEIVRSSDEKVLAKGRTLWCPVEFESGKPTRVSAAVRSLFSRPASSDE